MKEIKLKLESFEGSALSRNQSVLITGGATMAPDGVGNGTGTASNSGHSTGGEFGNSSLETPPSSSGPYYNSPEPLDPWIKYGSNYETP